MKPVPAPGKAHRAGVHLLEFRVLGVESRVWGFGLRLLFRLGGFSVFGGLLFSLLLPVGNSSAMPARLSLWLGPASPTENA